MTFQLFRFFLADARHICRLLLQDLQPLLGAAGELGAAARATAGAGDDARDRPRHARLHLAGARGYRGEGQAKAGAASSSSTFRLKPKYREHCGETFRKQTYLQWGGFYLGPGAPAYVTLTFFFLSFPLVFPSRTASLLSTDTFPPEQLNYQL